MIRTDTIYTDGKGVPIAVRPYPDEFAHHADYLRALCAYKDAVSSYAHQSFDEAFRKAMKRGRK